MANTDSPAVQQAVGKAGRERFASRLGFILISAG